VESFTTWAAISQAENLGIKRRKPVLFALYNIILPLQTLLSKILIQY
jgi:hypothetical protein